VLQNIDDGYRAGGHQDDDQKQADHNQDLEYVTPEDHGENRDHDDDCLDIVVRAATTEEWHVLRDTRLAALQDAPNAFGSSYAEQAASVEADWRRRVSRGCTFFAYVPEVNGSEPSGLVGSFQEEPGTVELVSLWVRPRVRGRGVGEALVTAVIAWANSKSVASVHLWLTETNQRARALYERCGFNLTGERQPMPAKPDLTEIGMIRPV
jgi:ribosomal protein S18 acetylase RimI-like enzyme